MTFNPKYKRIGLIAYLYFWIVEFLGLTIAFRIEGIWNYFRKNNDWGASYNDVDYRIKKIAERWIPAFSAIFFVLK